MPLVLFCSLLEHLKALAFPAATARSSAASIVAQVIARIILRATEGAQ